jgi:hypothetical protein
MLAHERLGVAEGLLQHRYILHRADVAEHHGRIALSPRSLARFIGDLLNALLNSSCDIPRSSRASCRASLAASAGRGAYAGSLSSWANLTLYGHTSWEEWRYNHFAIPLTTGVRTLRGEST